MSEPKQMTKPEKETLEAMLKRVGVPDDWDIVMVGDGSGSKWGYPIGWGCVTVRKDRMERDVQFGAASDGTVNIAEALAYLIPLSCLAADAAKNNIRPPIDIHIITDSEYVRTRGEHRGSKNFAHAIIWSGFELFSRNGFFLHWHWIPRDTVELNRFVDAASKHARACMLGESTPSKRLADEGWNVLDHNPWS